MGNGPSAALSGSNTNGTDSHAELWSETTTENSSFDGIDTVIQKSSLNSHRMGPRLDCLLNSIYK